MKNGITFIIPCYNPSAGDIQRCIDSIFVQKSPEDKIIIIDDGSNNSEEIKKIVDGFCDVSLIRIEKNSGVSNARNIGRVDAYELRNVCVSEL